MKNALLAAVLLWPAAAGAVSPESLSADAERGFSAAPASVRPAVAAAAALAQAPENPVLEMPALRSLGAGERLGAELGRVTLAAQLDRNLNLVKKTLGARSLDVGIVADAGAKDRFLSFTDASGTTLGKIGSLGDLRGKGIDIRIDASTVYNFRVEVGSIFDDPVHKSVLHITPIQGTVGPASQMTTGALLDAMRAQSAIVTIDGDEYWIFYGRESKTDGSGFTNSRGFLVTHEAGLSTKAWPIEESALPLDTPVSVTLGDAQVRMTRTSGGELVISSAN
jgi:hypothetical protein